MTLNPLKTTEIIVGKYIDYLTTTFSLQDHKLQQQLIKKFNQEDKFSRGPILEATPPFKKGCNLTQLIDEGILSSEFYNLKAKEELPLERTLYLHQEKALRKVITKDRNIIVATGTGSGKPEAFLIPILNHLFKEKNQGKLTPGVRALLLYPMNALANDQLKRLRSLLKNYSDITFGSYTGETEETYSKARDRYQKMHNGNQPLENELIAREQMKASPPHILLTNYAMLEYLILRPEDHTFFDGKYANNWKFIVLDEAHTYTGAKAIEMSMLLRRLKARVVPETDSLKCIATSATIGNGKQDFPEVAEFGQKLFNEPFEYNDSNPDQQDIIQAYRKGVEISHLKDAWGSPAPLLYLKWKHIIENETEPKIILSKLKQEAQANQVSSTIMEKADSKTNKNEWKKYIYLILKGDKNLIKLQRLLESKPQFLVKTASKIFPELKESAQYLIALVYLANKAKSKESEASLLPARYHLFIRAIEGAYISFLPEKKLFLERKEKHISKGEEYSVFEIGTCRQCNALYLIGDIVNEDRVDYLKQPGQGYYKKSGNLSYFLVVEDEIDKVTDNEDEIIKIQENSNEGKNYLLCPQCGNIRPGNSLFSGCECEDKPINLIKVKDKQGQVHKCPACGSVRNIGSIVWRFILGGDAVTSVLATSLYQQLPSDLPKDEDNHKEEDFGGWGNEVAAVQEEKTYSDNEGRQLLIFSDSRQDAAFFATYLNSTYQQIIRRQLIINLLQDNRKKVIGNKWRVQDLAQGLKAYLNHN
ncbi:MAG: DEAD/DEAH box helicase, partial [Bacillota bacterium]